MTSFPLKIILLNNVAYTKVHESLRVYNLKNQPQIDTNATILYSES
jgi:hypothetical protein